MHKKKRVMSVLPLKHCGTVDTFNAEWKSATYSIGHREDVIMFIHIPWLCYACGMQKQCMRSRWAKSERMWCETACASASCSLCVFVQRICSNCLWMAKKQHDSMERMYQHNLIHDYGIIWINIVMWTNAIRIPLYKICQAFPYSNRKRWSASKWAVIMLAQHRKYTVCIPWLLFLY